VETVMGTDRAKETVRRLRENITSGKWPVNSRIPTEAELVVELGVGRSTVREAVRALANLGMLEPARSRGTFVRARNPVSLVLADFITHHDVAEILAVRRAFEVEACQLAAIHRTDDDIASLTAAHEADVSGDPSAKVERGKTPGQFHALILAASKNQLLAQLYDGLMAGLRSSITGGIVVYGTDAATRHSDHAAILDAITAGDPVKAAQAAAGHADRDLVLSGAPADSTRGELPSPA